MPLHSDTHHQSRIQLLLQLWPWLPIGLLLIIGLTLSYVKAIIVLYFMLALPIALVWSLIGLIWTAFKASDNPLALLSNIFATLGSVFFLIYFNVNPLHFNF